MRLSRFLFLTLAAVGLFTNQVYAADAPQPATASAFEIVPPNKDNDLRIFYADGRIVKGTPALEKMNSDANLTMWLAGNQFFAMEDVIHAFQKAHPEVGNVAVITLPPGIIVKAITKGGWSYEGKDYAMLPDIYASVDLAHLKSLKGKGVMDKYMIYTHNALELMVEKGNPKHIKGIDDLARNDLRIMLPNPVELWDKLSGGKECKSCDPSPNVHFTSVHHREIPDGIKAGKVDVGINWATEIMNARKEGIAVDGVELPPEDSLINEVSYAIGALNGSKHQEAAGTYLGFLQSGDGQAAYAQFGFVNASKDDLEIKSIP